jgi:hypothetical protein
LFSNIWSAIPNEPAKDELEQSSWYPLTSTTGGLEVRGTGMPAGMSCAETQAAQATLSNPAHDQCEIVMLDTTS